MAIWSADNENTFDENLHRLCFASNLEFDDTLLIFDLRSLQAHAKMLLAGNYLSQEDFNSLHQELSKLVEQAHNGEFKMQEEYEDCHSLIESHLIQALPECGKKLYMARSRNDQVIQALRLFGVDKLKTIKQKVKGFANKLYDFAQKYENIPMVGYTHTQRAMPSSVGLWTTSYLETILKQKNFIESAIELNSVGVLGSAAGYGTSFNIDREIIVKELDLKQLQLNSLSCQFSRGQVECQSLQSLWAIMLVLNRWANDLVWLTSQEFNFITTNKKCTTGSSIMPNKKNLDPAEILRAKYHIFTSYINQLQSMISNLFFGYNSDYQETKAAFINGLKLAEDCLDIASLIITNIGVNEQAMLKAFDSGVFSTDLVNDKVKNGELFRDAYRSVKKQLDKVPEFNVQENINSKTHLGSTGNLGLDIYKKILKNW